MHVNMSAVRREVSKRNNKIIKENRKFGNTKGFKNAKSYVEYW